MTQRHISVLGSDVSYWAYGPDSGRTVLMVHGFRGNHVGLEKIIAGLGRYRVIAPDLPGYGLSTPMTELVHDVDGYSTFVETFINEMDLDRPVLLGHSFGSIIASHIAVTRSDLLSELVLVNPISVGPNVGINRPVSKLVEFYYWLSVHLPAPMADRVVGSKTFNRLMSLTLAKTRDPATRKAIYRHHLSDLDFVQDRRVITQSFADSLTRTAADDAERISIRTLLVAGARDGITPAKYQRLLNTKITGSTLVLIPGVGHLVHLETPLEAAGAIDAFLRESDAAGDA